MIRSRLRMLAVALFLPAAALAAPPAARVVIVGTYHFSNPGADQHNVQSDDVLKPERQQQVEAITAALMKFKPNRVAVEWPKALVDERYTQYLDGSLPESRNEVVQLGFRLAQAAHLKAVQGIDVEGDFPYDPVAAWADAHGQKSKLDAAQAFVGTAVARYEELQAKGTVASALHAMNDPAELGRLHGFYVEFLRYGGGDEQPGAALVGAWYQRNIAICARLLQAIESGDRVVVFYGQGHAYLLRQCVREAPGLELVDANALLP